jgi:hypothetical protein
LVKKLHEQRIAAKKPLSQTEHVNLINISCHALSLACKTRIASMICTALDCYQVTLTLLCVDDV